MKKENYIYTKKDIHIGFQFRQYEHIYEIMSINPLTFKNADGSRIYEDYKLSDVILQFNNCNWIPITLPQSQSQNIEL